MAKLLIRVGLKDDFHDEEGLEAVAARLKGHGITTPLERYQVHGVSTAGFEEDNHIGLYWGDPVSVFAERPLSDSEIEEINRLLIPDAPS